ncbi:Lysophospholipase [Schizosaccharomyces pombe]|uniref:Probable lysophospholipase 2 n=1 Tax=Schizosaccharomyces pombe (strain 972 / ATCC 24843) TaxID=284812 RepID=PLB2_SCHPO|nr:putative phospholipase [Schizosaccharomyces pombe]Q9UTH5.1 RecName: Full=Probable lysophospholipase C1786.02; AltName: Full=Phospholipase B; Flags: Precursor [Schizosaccharomyces pombe 972h-]CAB57433.1 phospholipase (predicted) [Schizosaccharomyces pombe]|eukprot:NP_594024.1 putative phospholipase [Schizosaccharomyces pombe]
MYFQSFYFLALLLATAVYGQVASPELHSLSRRNWKKPPPFPSTNASYAPVIRSCDSSEIMVNSLPRGELPDLENDFIEKRLSNANEALTTFLQSKNTTADLDLSSIVGDNGPRLGIAVSGGGWRSMLFGGGALAALDSRSNETTLGGLLQSAHYITGADGGSWLLSSLAVNEFRTIQNISKSIWYTRLGIFFIEETHFGDLKNYYTNVVDEVNQKAAAGFNVSLTDYWGRAIARHFVGQLRGGPNLTYSSVQNASWFQTAEYPYPLIVTQGLTGGLPDGSNGTATNSSIYEISPYYLTSFDNNVRSYTPTQYLGTNYSNGTAVDGKCVTQFDNVGFLVGTSSTRYNEALIDVSLRQSRMSRRLGFTLRHMRINGSSVSFYPNPYTDATDIAGNATAVSEDIVDTPYLDLFDGGYDGQNIPIWPLLQPERKLDVVFAFDSSGDTSNFWPNGSSLVATYERVTQRASDAVYDVEDFVHVPTPETFVNLGLNANPTFFGCDGRNTTRGDVPVDHNTPPLVVYMPNTPWTMKSNLVDHRYRIANSEIQALIQNGFVATTQDNSTDFASCLACAVVQRSLERRNQSTSAACQQCFSQYCWNGTVDNTPVDDDSKNPTYNPAVKTSSASGVHANILLSFFVLLATLLVTA